MYEELVTISHDVIFEQFMHLMDSIYLGNFDASKLVTIFSVVSHQMAEYFNKKSGLSGTVPLGSFNSMFSLTGSWKVDAAATKALAMDGFHFPLYTAKLMSDDLVLRDDVKRAVPRNWDPPLLARLVGNRLVCIMTRYCYHDSFLQNRTSSRFSLM